MSDFNCSPSTFYSPLRAAFLLFNQQNSPPFWPEWPKGHCPCWVVKLSSFVDRMSIWSCMALILLECSVLDPSDSIKSFQNDLKCIWRCIWRSWCSSPFASPPGCWGWCMPCCLCLSLHWDTLSFITFIFFTWKPNTYPFEGKLVNCRRCGHGTDVSKDWNTLLSKDPYQQTREDQFWPRSGSSLIHNSVIYVGTDVNEWLFFEIHQKNFSCTFDCSQLPYRI